MYPTRKSLQRDFSLKYVLIYKVKLSQFHKLDSYLKNPNFFKCQTEANYKQVFNFPAWGMFNDKNIQQIFFNESYRQLAYLNMYSFLHIIYPVRSTIFNIPHPRWESTSESFNRAVDLDFFYGIFNIIFGQWNQ